MFIYMISRIFQTLFAEICKQTISHPINTGIICYSYSSKAFIVYRWGESKGLEPIAKWGEAICEDKLVNIFEEHKDCRKGCGSVYYKLKEYDIPPKYSL